MSKLAHTLSGLESGATGELPRGRTPLRPSERAELLPGLSMLVIGVASIVWFVWAAGSLFTRYAETGAAGAIKDFALNPVSPIAIILLLRVVASTFDRGIVVGMLRERERVEAQQKGEIAS